MPSLCGVDAGTLQCGTPPGKADKNNRQDETETKKVIGVILVVAIPASMLVLGGCSGNKQAESKLCRYFPLPDPYADEVKGYAEQFAKDYNIDVKIMMGAALEQST